jgi:hypothetical protein
MTPALQKQIITLIEHLDDCFSINGATVNLQGLIAEQKHLRRIRQKVAPTSRYVPRKPRTGEKVSQFLVIR